MQTSRCVEILDHSRGAAVAAIVRVLAGRRTGWAVLVLAAVLSALALGLRGAAPEAPDQAAGLPGSAESARVAAAVAGLPSSRVEPALVVYSRDGAPLTGADEAAIRATAGTLGAGAAEPELAADRTAALVAVPLPADAGFDATRDAVDRLRRLAPAGLPAGVRVEVTGGPAFEADVARQFDGADTSLLLVTVAVVAVLLLVTYRSPWLWLVPLAVVGTADQVAAAVLVRLDRATGLSFDEATLGIVSVLVFGAGTNYALLLVARYREELRRVADRHEAMRRALTAAGPAIAASAGTVTLSLLTLLLASLSGNRSLGVAGAVGIVIALLYGLAVLPAALALFGRGLFWPFVPRTGQAEPTATGLWARVGAAVAHRPRVVAVASLLLLAGLAAGATGVRVGLSETEQFRVRVEAVAGQETLARAFPAGSAEPLTVVADPAAADRVAAAAAGVPGVAGARVAERTAGLARIDVVLTAATGTGAADDTIRRLRADLDGGALVGGPAAADLDLRTANARDRLVLVPAILLLVLAVLALLLRALVAPVLLVASVVATYLAALGAGWLLFRTVLDFPALDAGVPLLGFLFLVALGVDYNIFLTTRAREEAAAAGTRRGVLTALAVTGGVITSAGILLAAVFAVLGVLPLITLTQLGVVVGLGVLLDTLLVRSVLVPALVLLLGDRFWWPGHPARPPAPEPAVAHAGPYGGSPV
jgi:putative drug exporter of the RND superfamily